MPSRTRRDNARGTPLSRALSALRDRADLNQTQVADAAGLQQSLVSRFESARSIPDSETLPPLLDALHAKPEDRRHIVELIRKERARKPESLPTRVILERGAASFQQRVYDLEDGAQLVRSFHPTTILGVLQSEAYITAVFKGQVSDDELPRTVARRLERHRLLLNGSDRRWVLLQTEGALQWNFAGAEAMAQQMDSIAEVVGANEHIQVGVIPAMRHTPAQPMHGFHIYDFDEIRYRRDLRMGLVGTHSGTAILGEKAVNEDYVPRFEQLEQLAVYGAEARAILIKVADRYREMT